MPQNEGVAAEMRRILHRPGEKSALPVDGKISDSVAVRSGADRLGYDPMVAFVQCDEATESDKIRAERAFRLYMNLL